MAKVVKVTNIKVTIENAANLLIYRLLGHFRLSWESINTKMVTVFVLSAESMYLLVELEGLGELE